MLKLVLSLNRVFPIFIPSSNICRILRLCDWMWHCNANRKEMGLDDDTDNEEEDDDNALVLSLVCHPHWFPADTTDPLSLYLWWMGNCFSLQQNKQEERKKLGYSSPRDFPPFCHCKGNKGEGIRDCWGLWKKAGDFGGEERTTRRWKKWAWLKKI